MSDSVDQVGYSGTRHGMTPYQKVAFKTFLTKRSKILGVGILHHGLCIGGDTEAHEIARELGYGIFGHPPIDAKLQGLADTDCDICDRPFSFSGRNQRIVLASKVLFAAPGKKSVGTYNAWEHARGRGTPWMLVMPDGTTTYSDNWEISHG